MCDLGVTHDCLKYSIPFVSVLASVQSDSIANVRELQHEDVCMSMCGTWNFEEGGLKNSPATPSSSLALSPSLHPRCSLLAPGWKETASGYQYKVDRILESSLVELLKNKDRAFVWGDMSFLSHWLDKVKDEIVPGFSEVGTWHDAVKQLLRTRQLELVGGGWVSHDEVLATSHAAIANMQEGHSFIREQFGAGALPTVGWQIDPFGHSAATPRVYAAMGYKAMVLGRPDWRMRDAMEKDRMLEFWWGAGVGTCPAPPAAADADGRSSSQLLFTHMLHTHYQAPEGFDFSGSDQYVRSKSHV